jgi:hypothetical protein
MYGALWLFFLLPVAYLGAAAGGVLDPEGAGIGILSLVPFMGSLALVWGVFIGIAQRRRSLLYFVVSPFISECYAAVGGALPGQFRGNAGVVAAWILAVVQAFSIWFLIHRLKEDRLAACILALFCASYALFAWFVVTTLLTIGAEPGVAL